jgi:predicted RNA-binding protein with PIN domain
MKNKWYMVLFQKKKAYTTNKKNSCEPAVPSPQLELCEYKAYTTNKIVLMPDAKFRQGSVIQNQICAVTEKSVSNRILSFLDS